MITVKISDKTRYKYDENTNTLACWNWCIEHFGMPENTTAPSSRRWSWDTRYYFQFKNTSDATMFALMWA